MIGVIPQLVLLVALPQEDGKMQIVDYNWQALKQEDYSLSEKTPHLLSQAEDLKIVQWHNNPKSQKFTWRESMAPYTAWIDKGDSKGMWRSCENRIVEELQYELRNSHGYKIIKSTARDETGNAMLNVKIIEIQKDDVTQEVLLILDGQRIYAGKQGKIKDGVSWKFAMGKHLKHLL